MLLTMDALDLLLARHAALSTQRCLHEMIWQEIARQPNHWRE